MPFLSFEAWRKADKIGFWFQVVGWRPSKDSPFEQSKADDKKVKSVKKVFGGCFALIGAIVHTQRSTVGNCALPLRCFEGLDCSADKLRPVQMD